MNKSEYMKHYRSEHKVEIKAKRKEYHQTHKIKTQMDRKEWRKTHKDNTRQANKRYYLKNKEQIRIKRHDYHKTYQLSLFLKVLNHYSNNTNICSCCKESTLQFLTIDHIDGGGSKHRKSINKTGGCQFYKWLINGNFPLGYQILCFNCNCGRMRNNGICPHKQR